MDAFHIHNETMATLTIKNLPEEIYAALTRKAKQNRRSINGEAIVSLESSLHEGRPNKQMRLEKVRKLRESLPQEVWLTDDILAESRAELIHRSALVSDARSNKKPISSRKKSKRSK